MRTAILGAGALGIIIGARMTQNGQQVDLIDSFKENVDALNTQGAIVTGFLELHQPVHALTPEEMTGTYDLILLLTKQTANELALPKLLPHLHQDSVVCTLQNGVPEEAVASYVGKERTIGGAVGFGATWLKPGVSELTSTMEAVEKFAFEIGEIDGTVRPRLEKVKEVLSAAGGTTILTNLMGIRYTKLLMNATFSGMSAALNGTFSDVLANPQAMVCVAHIADEVIKVCHGLGYRMVEMQGSDFEFLELASKADIPSKMDFYKKVWGRHNNKASMLQDLEKGKKTEIDYINGVVCQGGRRCGIPTPFNDKVVELVKEAEARGGVNDFSYLARFNDLIASAK
ncbi:ketopantoate reductase family protein [bacterium BFN5]|nr:ketopantoate reductase family protein [bacterium BFN5]QJW46321.1 ketopantoate reductase family protein [bacterium BFN5]